MASTNHVEIDIPTGLPKLSVEHLPVEDRSPKNCRVHLLNAEMDRVSNETRVGDKVLLML